MMRQKVGMSFLAAGLLTAAGAWCNPAARIINLRGDVKVRPGVEERWVRAQKGMVLEEIDTILTGEDAEATLRTPDGAEFRLGPNAILDILDLRKVTERELFVFLTSRKIGKIPPRPEKTRLRIGNVTAVHGESKAGKREAVTQNATQTWWIKELNGARALQAHQYHPNAIMKLKKLQARWAPVQDCGEVHLRLARGFEALAKQGQARDEYRLAIEQIEAQGCQDQQARRRIEHARHALKRLGEQIR